MWCTYVCITGYSRTVCGVLYVCITGYSRTVCGVLYVCITGYSRTVCGVHTYVLLATVGLYVVYIRMYYWLQ